MSSELGLDEYLNIIGNNLLRYRLCGMFYIKQLTLNHFLVGFS